MDKLSCILLVDDDKITNYISSRLIKKLDLAKIITSCTNGEEALLYMTKHATPLDAKCPQLIILDNNMPEMNGIEFMESFNHINFSQDQMKVVVLTNSANPEDERKLKSLGIEDYITKPLTEEKLLDALQHQHLI